MKISDSIIKLIIEDNEATIPGFGIFKTENINASIHPITKEVTPPHKKLSFSFYDKAVSSKFERVFASENNLQIDDAILKIKEIVEQFIQELKLYRKTNIIGFATVKLNVDDSYDVIPDENVVFDKDYFALPSFQINQNSNSEIMEEHIDKSSQEEKEEIKPITIAPDISQNKPVVNQTTNDKPVDNEEPPKKKKSWIWILIIILFIGGIGVAGYIFKDKLLEVYHNTFSKVEVKVEKKDTVITETVEVVEEVIDTTIQQVVDTIVKEEIITETVKPVKTNNGNSVNYVKPVDISKIVYAPKGAGKFYVIAGSFKIIENAATLVAQLKKKGYDPVVIEKNEQGLIRVAYKPGFDTERLARDFADDLYENKNLLPWIVQY